MGAEDVVVLLLLLKYMHKMALLISHGCHTSDDQYMNAAPMIFQKRHDQREKIRWWWEYRKPKKKQRGLLHQLGHSMIIINLAMASIKDHDHHHFNIGVVAQDPAVICLAGLLFTPCSHFSQVRTKDTVKCN